MRDRRNWKNCCCQRIILFIIGNSIETDWNENASIVQKIETRRNNNNKTHVYKKTPKLISLYFAISYIFCSTYFHINLSLIFFQKLNNFQWKKKLFRDSEKIYEVFFCQLSLFVEFNCCMYIHIRERKHREKKWRNGESVEMTVMKWIIVLGCIYIFSQNKITWNGADFVCI